jgi:hypothetical protein
MDRHAVHYTRAIRASAFGRVDRDHRRGRAIATADVEGVRIPSLSLAPSECNPEERASRTSTAEIDCDADVAAPTAAGGCPPLGIRGHVTRSKRAIGREQPGHRSNTA